MANLDLFVVSVDPILGDKGSKEVPEPVECLPPGRGKDDPLPDGKSLGVFEVLNAFHSLLSFHRIVLHSSHIRHPVGGYEDVIPYQIRFAVTSYCARRSTQPALLASPRSVLVILVIVEQAAPHPPLPARHPVVTPHLRLGRLPLPCTSQARCQDMMNEEFYLLDER